MLNVVNFAVYEHQNKRFSSQKMIMAISVMQLASSKWKIKINQINPICVDIVRYDSVHMQPDDEMVNYNRLI